MQQSKDKKNGFLCISINPSEHLDIHNGLIKVRIKKIKGKTVFISVEAPREIIIARVKE
jgi:sRNA-binding carbon storage regulator CsrA